MTLVDSNILLDIFSDDPKWYHWSAAQLEAAQLEGPLLINDVIYAETSIRFEKIEVFDHALSVAGATLVPIPRTALFLAGKAFVDYRRGVDRAGGVLPDFLIGAHAAVARLPLLTRDVRRYRTFFPTVSLIAP